MDKVISKCLPNFSQSMKLWATFKLRRTCLHMCALSHSVLSDCDPMDCSLPSSSVHGIFQARILDSVAISSSRESSQPRDQTHVSWGSCIGRWILCHWASWEAWEAILFLLISSLKNFSISDTQHLRWVLNSALETSLGPQTFKDVHEHN